MMESYSHLWQVMIKYKSPSIIRKVESIHERRDNGVHLLCAELEGEEGADQPREGEHIVRSIKICYTICPGIYWLGTQHIC